MPLETLRTMKAEWKRAVQRGRGGRAGIGSLIKYHTTYYGRRGAARVWCRWQARSATGCARPKSPRQPRVNEPGLVAATDNAAGRTPPSEVDGGQRAVQIFQHHRCPFIKRPVWKFHLADPCARLSYIHPRSIDAIADSILAKGMAFLERQFTLNLIMFQRQRLRREYFSASWRKMQYSRYRQAQRKLSRLFSLFDNAGE